MSGEPASSRTLLRLLQVAAARVFPDRTPPTFQALRAAHADSSRAAMAHVQENAAALDHSVAVHSRNYLTMGC